MVLFWGCILIFLPLALTSNNHSFRLMKGKNRKKYAASCLHCGHFDFASLAFG